MAFEVEVAVALGAPAPLHLTGTPPPGFAARRSVVDVYSAADATAASPERKLVETLLRTRAGAQVLRTTSTLPLA